MRFSILIFIFILSSCSYRLPSGLEGDFTYAYCKESQVQWEGLKKAIQEDISRQMIVKDLKKREKIFTKKISRNELKKPDELKYACLYEQNGLHAGYDIFFIFPLELDIYKKEEMQYAILKLKVLGARFSVNLQRNIGTNTWEAYKKPGGCHPGFSFICYLTFLIHLLHHHRYLLLLLP